MLKPYELEAMAVTVFELPLSQWLLKIVLSIFFITGYNSVYVVLWHHANNKAADNSPHTFWYRLSVTVFCLLASLFLYAAQLAVNAPMLILNMVLFMLTLPLLATDIQFWEYLTRLGGLMIFLVATHAVIPSQVFIVGLAIFLGFCWVNWHYRNHINYGHLLPRIAFNLYLACLFWIPLTTPQGQYYASKMIFQGIAMYVVITIISGIYLLVQYRSISHDRTMTHLADYDALTHAKNYSMYTRDATELFSDAQKHGDPLTLMTLDVDHFKHINDTYGHLAGNAVLINIANTLQTTLQHHGKEDQIYRTGGEEFNIVFPKMTPEQANPIVNECWNAIRSADFKYKGQIINVTISVGVTAMRSDDSLIDDTYRRADESLYMSKQHGRDKVTVEGHLQNLAG